MTDRDRASGNPSWERAGSIGLPKTSPPAPATDATEPERPVARWLGWSPTSWRRDRP